MVETNKRIQVRFQGRVQGVGFRYRVISLSSSYDVVGYVRNDFDGSVELVAEGSESVLLDFLQKILQSDLKRYIMNHAVAWFAAKNEFVRFGIVY